MSISLLISGVTGKLGKVVAEELENTESIFLAGGHASSSNTNLGKPLNSILNIECKEKLISNFDNIDYEIDAVLDVSSIDNFSTGHSEDQLSSLKKYSEDLPILIAPNLSLGVNLLKKSLLLLKNNGSINKIEITETHHKEKKDSPSGTAKDLAEFIDKNLHLKAKTVVKSIRDESSVGTHEVKISLDNDELIITHNAFDRKIFAKGAIKAIEWIVNQKPGLYSMQEIIF